MQVKSTSQQLQLGRFFGLLLLLWFSSAAAVSAQGTTPETSVTTHHYADDQWEDLRDDLDYSGKPPAPKKEKAAEKAAEESTPPSSDWDFDFGDEWSMLMKVLFFTIIGTLLVLLIYSFLKNSEQRFLPEENATEASEDTEELLSLEELVEQLDTTEVDPYIREAEATQRYDLAVRLQFLATLKQLHQRGYIRWKKDRTNRAYLQQLYGQPPYTEFRELSRIFEHCWYGRNLPDAKTYAQLKLRYEQFTKQLKPVSTS